jgi:uncharacterized protein YbaA (DUF1428 family)
MYVDGFVLPIPDKNLDAYRKMARLSAKVWLEHGALHYVECRGDDVKPGKLTSFPQAVKLKPGETVWFSWIVYKSRQHRDAVMAKVMADPRMAATMDPKNMPFDGRRMFWGGFAAEIDARPAAKRRAPKKKPAPAPAVKTGGKRKAKAEKTARKSGA